MKISKLLIAPLMAIPFLTSFGCSAKTYHVKFTNGNEVVEERDYKENEVVIAPKDPVPYEKDHKTYTFDAWYENDVKFEVGLKATKDFNFAAKFTSKDVPYSVTFIDKGENVKIVTGKFGDLIEAPADPQGYDDNTDYYHYNFGGWYDGSTKFVKGETTITGNQSFTSKYTKGEPVTYTATFHAKEKVETVEFNAEDTTQTTPETGVTPTTGYTIYWLIGSDKVKPGEEYNFIDYLGSAIEVNYSGEIINTHKITLKIGDSIYDQIEATYGEKVLSEKVPQTEDEIDKIDGDDHYYYHFTGKWTKTKGGIDYVTDTDTLGDTDMDIYAEFKKDDTDPIIYEINFYDTDGELVKQTQEIHCNDGESEVLTATAPEITEEPVVDKTWKWVSEPYNILSNATINFGDDDENKLPIDNYDFVLTLTDDYTITYVLGDEAAVNPGTNPTIYKDTDTVALSAPSLDGFTFKGWYLDENEHDKFQYQEGWNPGDVSGNLTLYADWHITDKTLNDYSWSKISEFSNNGTASKHFDIGETKTITIDSVDHQVRIIDYRYDILSNPSNDETQYAGITFDFVNTISDFKTYWESDTKTTYDFIHSSDLNDCLQPEGEVYNKLNSVDGLMDVIKTVNKKVDIHPNNEWIEGDYNTKLFPLSYDEIDGNDDGTYEYYKTDSKTRRGKGAIYWLRSPNMKYTDMAYRVQNVGSINQATVWMYEHAVAPAFCI